MADLDLRPLTLGEVLDRTFTLYRRNFLLFVGITALPQLLILAFHLFEIFIQRSSMGTGSVVLPTGTTPTALSTAVASSPSVAILAFVAFIVGLIIYIVAYLFAQGGTVFAVSECYLGRQATILESLKRMRGEVGSLFGVVILNGLAIMGGLILLIIPGIYLACRLITCVPAALLENLGPRDSLSRSFALTKSSAGRAFVIYLLYIAILYGAMLLLVFPSTFGLVFAARSANVGLILALSVLTQVGTFVATVLVTPIFTIATAVFYYDLRVRKEAFDLQLMMSPTGSVATGTAGVPNVFT